MPILEQKTIGGETYRLKRRNTDRTGKQYEYLIDLQGGGRVEDPVYTKQRAMQLWRETIRHAKVGYEREQEDAAMGPFLNAGDSKPFVPDPGGHGIMPDDDDGSDDDPFRLF